MRETEYKLMTQWGISKMLLFGVLNKMRLIESNDSF